MKIMASMGFFLGCLECINHAVGSERIQIVPAWVYFAMAALWAVYGLIFIFRCRVVEE